MTPGIAILDQFESLGGRVTLARGERLRCEFPRDAGEAWALIEAIRLRKAEVLGILRGREETLETSIAPECPIVPPGVRLVRYASKTPPVAVQPCSIVTDVSKFIRANLRDLEWRLRNPKTYACASLPEILAKLSEIGVELALETPAENLANERESGDQPRLR